MWGGWVVSFTLLPLYPRGNSPGTPLYRRLGGLQSQSWRYGEEKNLLPLLGNEPRFLAHPAGSLVTIPTELQWKQDVGSTELKEDGSTPPTSKTATDQESEEADVGGCLPIYPSYPLQTFRNEQGICPMCIRGEIWGHILRCEGSTVWRDGILTERLGNIDVDIQVQGDSLQGCPHINNHKTRNNLSPKIKLGNTLKSANTEPGPACPVGAICFSLWFSCNPWRHANCNIREHEASCRPASSGGENQFQCLLSSVKYCEIYVYNMGPPVSESSCSRRRVGCRTKE
jgi:hypothetical protein